MGSVDANRGDLLLGWDTDQFPIDIYSTTKAMMIILMQGGLGTGGLNFDAKTRRSSIDTVDLFYAHIGGMDAFARGLLIAHMIVEEGKFNHFVSDRYKSFQNGIGQDLLAGKFTFEDAENFILRNGMPKPNSGRQELLENIFNEYLAN